MKYLKQGVAAVDCDGRTEQVKYWVYEHMGYCVAIVSAWHTQEVRREFDASEYTLQQVMYWVMNKAIYEIVETDDSCYGYDEYRDMCLADS